MKKILTTPRLIAALYSGEIFYLVVGCALLLAIHWPTDKVFLKE